VRFALQWKDIELALDAATRRGRAGAIPATHSRQYHEQIAQRMEDISMCWRWRNLDNGKPIARHGRDIPWPSTTGAILPAASAQEGAISEIDHDTVACAMAGDSFCGINGEVPRNDLPHATAHGSGRQPCRDRSQKSRLPGRGCSRQIAPVVDGQGDIGPWSRDRLAVVQVSPAQHIEIVLHPLRNLVHDIWRDGWGGMAQLCRAAWAASSASSYPSHWSANLTESPPVDRVMFSKYGRRRAQALARCNCRNARESSLYR